ncbi:universal stress protein [Saccharomonospora sp. NPDC006951]
MSAEDAASGAVVVGVDGSESSAWAVEWAAALAAQRDLPVRIVHAYGLIGRYYGAELAVPMNVLEAVDEDARRLVTEAAEQARGLAPRAEVTSEVFDEPPIPLLNKLSAEAKMVVLGQSGLGGFAGMLAGSTALGVASHASAPVAIVRRRENGEPPAEGPVVVGVDGSRVSEHAVAVAFEEASFRSVPLVAVHAWMDVEYPIGFNKAREYFETGPVEQEEHRVLAERLAGWQEKYPDVPVERVVVRDKPRNQLLDRSREAQLVVVGSRGRGGFTGMLLGSTSQALLHHAECPVLIARPVKGE